MFTPKLIVTDLDGTALNNNKEITTETIKAFERCRKKGIHIAIATARYIVGASYYAKNFTQIFRYLPMEHLYMKTADSYIHAQ